MKGEMKRVLSSKRYSSTISYIKRSPHPFTIKLVLLRAVLWSPSYLAFPAGLHPRVVQAMRKVDQDTGVTKSGAGVQDGKTFVYMVSIYLCFVDKLRERYIFTEPNFFFPSVRGFEQVGP